ncbi:MAG: hypothetical protein IJ649_04730 [Oscillospiraceae bacterium]|nr:hypothetical protein [Oscillospiraceae bacterium]
MGQLRLWLYQAVAFIARVHDSISAYNWGLAAPFTDKEMHFIVTAVFGLLLFLLILPLFYVLTKHGRAGIMAWMLAFMTVLFVTFAIEVGQQVTGTGGLELEDIVYSVIGFLAVSVGVGVLYLLYLLVKWIVQ